MKPDEKPTEIVLDATTKSSAAVHSDTLWSGPRWVHHATEKPVWVETKTQYWELLSRHGFRMIDQAESTTKHEELREPDPVPVAFTPHPTHRPMSQGEADLWICADAVFRARQCHVVVFSCLNCFARNTFEWCQVQRTPQELRLTCKGGTFGYRVEKGTDGLGSLPTLALKSEMPMMGAILTAVGEHVVPASTLTDQEAVILKAFFKVLRQREIEPHVFHADCFKGDPTDVSNEVGMMVTPTDVALACSCRLLVHRSVRHDDDPAPIH